MFTFINKLFSLIASQLYDRYFERTLKGRYITLEHLIPMLKLYQQKGLCDQVGMSEEGQPIYRIKIGNGKKHVLAWSQMHGNESTTTKAVMDFIGILFHGKGKHSEIDSFFKAHTLHVIPILNPDGAQLYTRANINKIDLNRDAKDVSQKESKVLRRLFESVSPSLCLNLHDQRTFYSLPGNKPATLSFLSPSADQRRNITDSRLEAMRAIVKIYQFLNSSLPGQIGRYDDAFNENCVGDQFQMEGIPTVLVEAGHYPGDYQREVTRKYVAYAFMALFGILESTGSNATIDDYLGIPENQKNCRDIILRNVQIKGEIQDLALQYAEVLEHGVIQFIPEIDSWGDLKDISGHKEIDFNGREVQINTSENVFVGEKVATIFDKKLKKIIKL